MGKTVSFNTPFGELQWEPNEDEMQVAWLLYVELSTRVVGFPVDGDTGFARDGLRSIYDLFQRTRDALLAHKPTIAKQRASAGSVAIYMLNGFLRPFLTRWHESLCAWEDGDANRTEPLWPERQMFFEELAALREDLDPYRTWFAQIADVHIL